MKSLLYACVLFALAHAWKLPPSFDICGRDHPTIDKCLVDAIEKAVVLLKPGLPKNGVPGVDPLIVPSMTIGEGSGPVHVTQHFDNVHLYGISKTRILRVSAKVKDDKPYTELVSLSPSLLLAAQYDFNGRILLLPIIGKGNCTVKLVNVKVLHKITGRRIQKKGKEYVKQEDWKITLEPEKVEFNFENLFNGDPRLGKEMNNILNENWKDVFDDVRPGYEESLALIFKDYANRIFLGSPYDDVYPKGA